MYNPGRLKNRHYAFNYVFFTEIRFIFTYTIIPKFPQLLVTINVYLKGMPFSYYLIIQLKLSAQKLSVVTDTSIIFDCGFENVSFYLIML